MKTDTLIVLLNPKNGETPKGFIAKLIVERHGVTKILKTNGQWEFIPSGEILFVSNNFIPKR